MFLIRIYTEHFKSTSLVLLIDFNSIYLFQTDASNVQISTDTQISFKSPPRHVSVLRTQTYQNANKVPGQTVAEIQHENIVRYLPESQAPSQR